jgi:MFS family permease
MPTMSTSPDGSKPTNVRWMIVALLTGLVFLAHFNRVGISVAANEHFIGPDRMSEEQVGLVYSAFLFPYTLLMMPGGWLIDRVGPRWAMTGMGVGFGLLAATTGILGWLGLAVAALLGPLLVVRGLAGVASAPLHPGAARTVSLWLPMRERSSANGFINAGALVGIALTYPLFGWLMDRLGWPSAFVASGATLASFALVWRLLSADGPAGHRWSNAEERQLVADDRGGSPRVRASLRDAARLLGNRSLLLLTLSYGMIGYVQYMFFYWIEYYFGKELKLSPTESRGAAFTITMAMAAGMAGGGWVSDGLCRRIGYGAGCRVMALVGFALGAVFCLLGVSAGDPRTVVLWFSLALGAIGLCEGVFWTTAPALEPRQGGLACAVLNTGGNGVGLLAPIITPVIGRHYGWTAAVELACGLCLLGGLLWFGITPRATGESDSGPSA